MLLIARFGLLLASPSIRVNVTAVGSAFALCETNRRHVVVDAHNVLESDGVRASQPTLPPFRSPRDALVSVAPPICIHSPQTNLDVGFGVTSAVSPVNSLQCLSRSA